MPISFKCPQCGKVYKNLSDEYAGKQTKCKCGKVLILGAAKPAPVQPTPVQPTLVQPTVEPAPAQPIPVQPVPIQPVQPVAPVPIHQAYPADPSYGAPPQSVDPLGGYHGGYAPPPAPMYAPQHAGNRPRKRRSGKNPAGPILSIIGGVVGLILGTTMAIININFMIWWINAWSKLGAMGEIVGTFFVYFLNSLATIAMAGAGIYCLVLGILELSNNYRKSIASKLALIISAVYAFLVIIMLIINIVHVSSDDPSGGFGDFYRSDFGVSDVIDHVLFAFLLLIIPVYLIFVGIFRWNDDS